MYRVPRTANKQPEQRQNRPQEPSPPNHEEHHKYFQKPSWRRRTCIHCRTKHCAAPSRCTNGHSNLVQELDEPKTATAEAPQFSAQPNQSTCRCTATSASTTIPRTDLHGLLYSVHCAYQDLHATGKSTTLSRN